MKAYILSRTEMNGGRFCTCVAIQEDGIWRQVRLLNLRGQSPFPHELTQLTEAEITRHWNPGIILEIPVLEVIHPRLSHPEDARVDMSTVQFYKVDGNRRVLTADAMKAMIGRFSFDEFRTLYPNLAVGDRYVPSGVQPRSVGYVTQVYARIYNNGTRARLTDNAGNTLDGVPIVGQGLKGHYTRNTQFRGVTVRLSLANPWNADWMPDGEHRCYVQLSDIVGQNK